MWIAKKAHRLIPVRIIADLANCTKHLVMDKPWLIKEGAALDSSHASALIGSGSSTTKRWFNVRVKTGAIREGAELLDEAIAAWDELLKRHRLL